MFSWDSLQDRLQAVIERALRVAAEGVITYDNRLAFVPSESFPFHLSDRRTRRISREELHHHMDETRRHAAGVPGET